MADLKRYTQTSLILPPLKTTSWGPVGFQPDLWQAQTDSVPSAPVFVAPRNDLQPGKPTVNGSAEANIPGVGGEYLYFFNSSPFAVKVYVTASLGYLPGVSSAPVSVVQPLSVDPIMQSQYFRGTTGAGPITIQFPHPGGALMVWRYMVQVGGGPVVTSITAGGVALSNIDSVGQGGNTSKLYLFFAPDVPANPQLQIVISVSGSTEDSAEFVFAFQSGVALGGRDKDNWSTGAATNIDVPCGIATKISALLVCVAAGGGWSETSGAILLQDIPDTGAWNSNPKAYIRKGQSALQTFVVDPPVQDTVAIGVAIYIPGS